MLSYSLQYDHILYSMNNETCADKRWGQYWAGYIREKAVELGKTVYLTDMFDSWDPTDGNVKGAVVQDSAHHPGHSYYRIATPGNTYTHPEVYNFVDISNHNVQVGETHYLTARYVLDRIVESGIPRPVTCVKIYGGPQETFWDGTSRDGQERFWRNVFAGISAVRFHRPSTGIGLSDTAKWHIRSMRMLSDEIPVWDFVSDNAILGDRAANEAFCLANAADNKYCVYFPAAGEVILKLPESEGGSIRWLNILEAGWLEEEAISDSQTFRIKTPGDSHWVAMISLQ